MEHRSVAQRALPPPKSVTAGVAATTTTTATSSTTTSAHCVAYARDASFLAVGMEAGFLHILDTRVRAVVGTIPMVLAWHGRCIGSCLAAACVC